MNNTILKIIGVVVLAFFFGVLGAKWVGKSSHFEQPKDLLSTVLSKGEIRIGYVIQVPALCKDPNTGQLSGIHYDVVQEMGKRLNLKMVWVEETGWSSMVDGIQSGRYDMVVGGIWPNSSRAKRANFSVPLYYQKMGVFARMGDHRFKMIDDINHKSVTVATIDGDAASFLSGVLFSSANVFSLPEDSNLTHKLLSVKTRKADVTLIEQYNAEEYMAQNPKSVHQVLSGKPIAVFGSTILLPQNQSDFEAMINVSVGELLQSGFVNRLVKKYSKYLDVFYLVSTPYVSY